MAQCDSCSKGTVKTQQCGCASSVSRSADCISPLSGLLVNQPAPGVCIPASNFLDVGTAPAFRQRCCGWGCGCGCGRNWRSGTLPGIMPFPNITTAPFEGSVAAAAEPSPIFNYRMVPDLVYGGESVFTFDGTSTIRRYIRPSMY